MNGHSNYVLSLAVLQNGNLASASADNSIRIWNGTDGGLIKKINAHSSNVLALAELKNGLLASGSLDKTIKVWDTDPVVLNLTSTSTIKTTPKNLNATTKTTTTINPYICNLNFLFYPILISLII